MPKFYQHYLDDVVHPLNSHQFLPALLRPQWYLFGFQQQPLRSRNNEIFVTGLIYLNPMHVIDFERRH